MYFDGRKVLVTGGTGSMGKVLVRRILSGELGNPQKVIVFSRDEAKQHDMRVSYLQKTAASTDEIIYRNFMNALEFRIGDVRDFRSVCGAVKDVDIVINAAALKQVPTCEYFVHEAISTNCLGAANIVRAINENNYPIDTVLGISTDKAVKPVNVMGMTKSLQERIFISANVLNKKTRFACVRYGNVLASRGSVIPLFHHQVKNGGPITITVPTMTRFLLSLNQAVDTVFAALQGAKPGEIYIPNARSATVIDIARALIGDRAIGIKETGIRPGEKMHEILISDEEAPYTVKRGNYYVIQSMLPELVHSEDDQALRPFKKEFSSEGAVLSLEETLDLLGRHELLIGQNGHLESGELLR
jgi:FlaA1/EpsC-like NDP-sugar epimerase